MNAVLTIVGSSARAAAQSAARSGLVVFAADLFHDTDLFQVATATAVEDYPGGLEDVLSGPQPGGWLYTGALENYPELVERWQRVRPLLGNPASVLRQVRNPELIAEIFNTAGLASPAIRRQLADLPRDGTWLAKPLRSAGGANVARIDAHWQEPASPSEYYFQQRIEGKPVAAVYLASDRDVVLLGVTEQLCGTAWGADSEFRYCGSLGPCELSSRVLARFQQIGKTLHDACGLIGLFGVDAILSTDNDIWPVEVNPRYTASIEVLERAMGLAAVRAHLAACSQRTLVAPRPATRQSGKLIVWARAECRFPPRDQLPIELRENGTVLALADIPPDGARIKAGWPIATVMADADSADQVRDLLMMRAATLQEACSKAAAPNNDIP